MTPGARHAASALVATTVGVLPSFLFGGLAPLIRADLGFEARWIGFGVAAYFVTSSLGSVPGGRLGERLGSQHAMWVGIGVSTTVLLGIALFADSLAKLIGFLALAGFGNAIIQPAANLALARGVVAGRQGLAFGFKQAAIPMASGLSGFAVPLLGLTLGWRAAFMTAAVLPVLAAILPLPDVRRAPRGPRADRPLKRIPGSLYLLAAGIGFASAAALAMGAYFVESAISAGWDAGQAGTLLGVGGMLGITTRIGVGWIADRMHGGWLKLVGAMMIVGGIGFGLMSFVGTPWVLLIALPLAFGPGWGHNGLFNFAVVRLHRDAPAAATGVTLTGAFAGSVFGPPLFGVVADLTTNTHAWLMLAALNMLGGVFVLLGRARVFAERERS